MVPFCLVLAACGANSSTAGSPGNQEFESIDDVSVDFGAYEVAVTSSGIEPFVSLLRPPAVGLTETYDVAIWHSDDSGREQGTTAKVDITVLTSAADGSAAELAAEFHEIQAWVDPGTLDVTLTDDLSKLAGTTTIFWLDVNRVVAQSTTESATATVGAEANRRASELFDIPALLAVPTPAQALGEGATWAGATRAANGVETVITGRIDSLSSGRYRLIVDLGLQSDASAESGSLGSGQLIIVGAVDAPFSDEKHLVVEGSDGSGAVATIDFVLSSLAG